MTWWGTPLSSDLSSKAVPIRKNRFLLLVGGQPVLTVKTVTKPSAEVETKSYKMINHHYNYPGVVKWNPIEVTLVDGNGFIGGNYNKLATAEEMWRMLMFSGYANPDMTKTANYKAPNLSTPEKASFIQRSAGKQIQIAHLDPDGKQTLEFWDLINPMITKFNWGSLDYGSDELVEYSFTITYDWARWNYGPENKEESLDQGQPPVRARFEGDSNTFVNGQIPDGITLPGENQRNARAKYNKRR